MQLVIVHYHLRPGGIRRIIELATPHLVRQSPRPVTRIVLATGQRADRSWHCHFASQLDDVPVEVVVEPTFNYLSEQRGSPARIASRIRRALELILPSDEDCLVWAHNLGVGRNLLLSRELAAVCAERDVPLMAHHHDWWFDNRWVRWPEMRRFGFRQLSAPARAVFPERGSVRHVAINHADARVLQRHFGPRALWLPNLTEPGTPPATDRIAFARRWLRHKLAHDGAPVWLLPCRTLRRKNIAEALLLKRWLRPEAWLVVTGTASSADELPYFQKLECDAHQHHWRLRLGVLAGDESRTPTIPELLAASEAVLLTSIQEGFGLPYLEAAAAQRPLLARRLPNIAPDLDQFGFRFPQAYDEIRIAPELFDWAAERARQRKLFHTWRASIPASARVLVSRPQLLASSRKMPVPFSRLTLTAQLEVLVHPPAQSWKACAHLNPLLKQWRPRAAEGSLRVTPWPRAAKQWLGGSAYARRFFSGLQGGGDASSHGWDVATSGSAVQNPGQATRTSLPPASAAKVQSDFIASKLDAGSLYPLLWSKDA